MIHIDKNNMVAASGLLLFWMILIVGRETVLASPGSHELRCGRRLVSGLFSRPRLPLGYSYVTTVPRGACRLNVSEILPSDNYIALKISNGSYIINGDFAVSIPGNYDAAGARFVYSRAAGVDKIFAYGPLLQPIDIMILYTEPNPSITYEYFVQSLDSQDETETLRADAPESPVAATEHSRRHHISFIFKSTGSSARPDVFGVEFDGDSNKDVDDGPTGGRKFSWKVMGYTQCSRSCGGGIQIAKYRCVEAIPSEGDREVSSIHCSGPSPPPRRRRCGAGPCAPRWRSATWSTCPQCGPANRTRIVGCVQDHSRGITKISDQKCPPQKPVTFEKCNIPDCNPLSVPTDDYGVRYVEPKRSKPVELTESFRYGPEYSVAANSTYFDIGPEYTFSAAGGWLYTEWSECTGWCVGGGVQTRAVRCADPSGCAPRRAPDSARPCALPTACEPLEGQWFTGDWSECSSPCNGKQIRGVLCVGGTGRHLRDSACKEARPSTERECASEDCEPTWFMSDWGKCISNCTGKPFGVSRRSVVCARGGMSDAPVNELECAAATRPHASRDCVPRCASQMTQPPEFIVESERSSISDTTTPFTTTTTTHKEELMSIEVRPVNKKGCKDKLPNCFLAVQARLCHYSYYIQNCCHSCKGK